MASTNRTAACFTAHMQDTSSAPPMRVALIGYGLAGRIFHAPLIMSTSGLELSAVVTANAERRQALAADLPDIPVLGSADDVWEQRANFDVVVVASANATHVPFTLAALQHGLHVVADKPIAGSASEAEHIAKVAAANGRQVFPFQNRRWDSDFLTLRAVLAENRIGTVHRFESRIERIRTEPKGTWREESDPQALGGVLIDLGAHLIDQALQILGPVHRVFADARSVRFPGSADDDALIRLHHIGGAVSTLTCSQASAFPDPRFLVMGTTGAIRITDADTQEDALRAGRRPDADWGREAPGHVAILRHASGIEESEPFRKGAWDTFYPGVVATLTTGAPVPVPLDNVIANMRVLDAARASVASSQSVVLNPPAGHQAI